MSRQYTERNHTSLYGGEQMAFVIQPHVRPHEWMAEEHGR